MQRSITLRNVCACGIAAALEVLAEEAREHLKPNHPDYPTLAVLRTEKHMLPLPIKLPDNLADYGLYSELPSPHNPLGKRVLEVAVRLCAGCSCQDSHGLTWGPTARGAAGRGQGSVPGHVQVPGHVPGHVPGRDQGQDWCRDRCHGCTKACSAELTVHIAQLPDFPFPPDEVDGFFYRHFDMPELVTATVPREYRFTYTVARQEEAAAPPTKRALPETENEPEPPNGAAADGASPGAGAAGTSQPAQHRGRGAPQLDCNAWLYQTMCAMSDPRCYGHLRPEWQKRYLQQMGVAPAVWDKSFREAARHYLHRILHDRGELGGRQGGQEGGQGGDREKE